MWEYLSLYSERDSFAEAFFVKRYRENVDRVPEEQVINELGAEGWELVAVVPAYGGGGGGINHQLYFKRRPQQWGE